MLLYRWGGAVNCLEYPHTLVWFTPSGLFGAVACGSPWPFSFGSALWPGSREAGRGAC